MTISKDDLYPRSNDKATIYLNNAITKPNIFVGDYTKNVPPYTIVVGVPEKPDTPATYTKKRAYQIEGKKFILI